MGRKKTTDTILNQIIQLWKKNNLSAPDEVSHTKFIVDRGSSAIAEFTDEELWQELERRGWEGELSRRQVVTIGTAKF